MRIEQQRPIPCQYAQGPTFRLSESDEKVLSELLKEWATDPELRGLEAIGWYRSRTRSALRFDAQDTAFGERFFPGGAPVALVVHPTIAGTAPCAWFVRDTDGVFGAVGQGEAPHLEVADRSPRETAAPRARRLTSGSPAVPPVVAVAVEEPVAAGPVAIEPIAAGPVAAKPVAIETVAAPMLPVAARRRRIPRVVIRVKLPLLGSMAVAVVVFAMILLLVMLPPMAAK